MVFFTCNNCGESVKKPAVEKHYNTRCRNNPKNVSCMDCLKDFHGEEYAAHTKCITEAEKYSGKNYVAKENKNSGQKKQETWMDIVRSILETSEYQLSAQTRNIFQRLQNFENVPRKKAKFQNFVSNSLKIPANQAQPAWTVLEKELEKMKQTKQQEVAASKAAIEEAKKAKENQENGKPNGLKRKPEDNDDAEEKIEKKNKKKKNEENEEPTVEANGLKETVTEESEIFQWSSVIEKFVAKHEGDITLEKLKKKVLKKYKNKLQLEDLNEKQLKKFEKKFSKTLKKFPAFNIENVCS